MICTHFLDTNEWREGGASPTRFLSEPDVRGLFQNYKEIESYPAVGERRKKKKSKPADVHSRAVICFK